MLTGGALLGIVFSYLAAQATAERLDEDMGRRAGRMTAHVVLAGLGTVGFRLARQLTELGLPFVVVEQAGTRFAADIRAPILNGDARLPETLERANIGDARVLIACTDNDVANIGACLHARRRNPSIVTVARIFDDALASGAFGITRTVSASGFAASAFVSAARDENAVRVVRVGALELHAARLVLSDALSLDAVTAWREQGVRVLAFRVGNTARRPSELTKALSAGDELVICGPAAAVDILLSGSNLLPPAVSE